MKLVEEVEIENLKKLKSGKVREMFAFNNELLIVTTDRISAFDFILPSLIPLKGIILNKISIFWFNFVKDIISNHLVETDFNRFPKVLRKYKDTLNGRSVIVKKVKIFPIECVVRGYIAGSAWEEYRNSGRIGDSKLPPNLKMCDRLPEPIFTPTTKEISGHDVALTINKAKRIFGTSVVDFLMNKSIEIYLKASEYALRRGLIVADTKFEFGAIGNEIVLADEVLTPDSSRFWPLDEYKPGKQQNSFDKQYVRDYLLSTDWDRKSIPPKLPQYVVSKTTDRYVAAYEKLVGEKFE